MLFRCLKGDDKWSLFTILEHKSFHLCHSIQIHNNPDHFYKDIDNFHQKDKCNHQHIESLMYISVGTHHLLYIFDLKNNPNLIDISSSTLQDHCNHKRWNLFDQIIDDECKLTYHKVDFHCSHLDQSIPSSIHRSHGICNQRNSHYQFDKSHNKVYDLHDNIDLLYNAGQSDKIAHTVHLWHKWILFYMGYLCYCNLSYNTTLNRCKS